MNQGRAYYNYYYYLLLLLLLVATGKLVSGGYVIESETGLIKTCQKPHFVLVHGYGGGAWVWYKIRTLLESMGYKVTALDLKSCGIDRSDPDTILTFQDYDEPLMSFLANLTDTEKVILVGHSAGGLSLTHGSHEFSSKIQVAIYVAAQMWKHGLITDQYYLHGGVTKSDMEDPHHSFSLGRRQLSATLTVREEWQHPQINPQEDAVLLSMLFRPGPSKAMLSARFEGDRADAVKRVYIKTLYDTAIEPEKQDEMIEKWPPSQVFVVKSNHYAMFSDPFLLSGMLVEVASPFECN